MLRTMRWVSSVGLAAALVAGCAAEAPAGAVTAAPSADTISPTAVPTVAAPATPAPYVPVSVPLGASSEIYFIPSKSKGQDGTFIAHSLGATSADRQIGHGTGPIMTHAVDQGTSPALLWGSTNASVTIDVAGEADTSAAVESVPLTTLDLGGTRYFQNGTAVVANKNGTATASYPLPVLKPDPSAGNTSFGFGIGSSTRSGIVSALLPATNGDILAFSYTGWASAVTDLTTGQTTLIPGFPELGQGVRAASGDIDLIAWTNGSGATVKVLDLDGASYQIKAALDTKVATANYLWDTQLTGLDYDSVGSFSSGDETTGIAISVWTVQNGQIGSAYSLPTNSGLWIAPATTTTAYVFGGPARNTVGVIDLTSGQFTPDLPALRAPAGSYIVALTP